MKHVKYLLGMALSASVLSTPALAAFSVDQLAEAAKASIDDFKTTNAEHVQHLTGYKVWKADEAANVKIYIDHDGMAMEFDYVCQNGTAVSCVAQ